MSKRYAVMLSDPSERQDRAVAFRVNRQAALRVARDLNARVIAERGLPQRGRPVPLYYVCPEKE